MDAAVENAPIKKKRSKELDTRDIPMEQKSPINLGMASDGPFVPPSPDICMAEGPLQSDYAQALAFNEEPVEIIVHEASNEEFPAQYVDCWVNGIGIEVWDRNTKQWLSIKQIPVNERVIVKRKYVEVLLKSKVESIRTNVVQKPGEDPQNFLLRAQTARCPITIMDDKNPRGREWASRIVGMVLS